MSTSGQLKTAHCLLRTELRTKLPTRLLAADKTSFPGIGQYDRRAHVAMNWEDVDEQRLDDQTQDDELHSDLDPEHEGKVSPRRHGRAQRGHGRARFAPVAPDPEAQGARAERAAARASPNPEAENAAFRKVCRAATRLGMYAAAASLIFASGIAIGVGIGARGAAERPPPVATPLAAAISTDVPPPQQQLSPPPQPPQQQQPSSSSSPPPPQQQQPSSSSPPPPPPRPPLARTDDEIWKCPKYILVSEGRSGSSPLVFALAELAGSTLRQKKEAKEKEAKIRQGILGPVELLGSNHVRRAPERTSPRSID